MTLTTFARDTERQVQDPVRVILFIVVDLDLEIEVRILLQEVLLTQADRVEPSYERLRMVGRNVRKSVFVVGIEGQIESHQAVDPNLRYGTILVPVLRFLVRLPEIEGDPIATRTEIDFIDAVVGDDVHLVLCRGYGSPFADGISTFRAIRSAPSRPARYAVPRRTRSVGRA